MTNLRLLLGGLVLAAFLLIAGSVAQLNYQDEVYYRSTAWAIAINKNMIRNEDWFSESASPTLYLYNACRIRNGKLLPALSKPYGVGSTDLGVCFVVWPDYPGLQCWFWQFCVILWVHEDIYNDPSMAAAVNSLRDPCPELFLIRELFSKQSDGYSTSYTAWLLDWARCGLRTIEPRVVVKPTSRYR